MFNRKTSLSFLILTLKIKDRSVFELKVKNKYLESIVLFLVLSLIIIIITYQPFNYLTKIKYISLICSKICLALIK